MKAQEFRNLNLFFFPVILKCLEKPANERKLWLQLSFMLRSCVIPNDEFEHVDQNQILSCMDKFYNLFEQLFGEKNCSYSIHLVGSHLLQIRGDEPLPSTSAFPFENFYGEMRNAFVPGTSSTAKQILRNILIKRILGKHNCEASIYLSPNDTPSECNSMVYVYEPNEGRFPHKMYKITSIDDDVLTCQTMGKYEATFEETPNVDWTSVGVYKRGGILTDPVLINRNQVSGKVLSVHDYLITCPNNVLREK